MLRYLIIILFTQLFNSFLNAKDLDPPEAIKLTFDITNNHLHIYWNHSASPNLDYYEVWYPNDSVTLGVISSIPVQNTIVDTTTFDKDFELTEALWYSMGFYVRAFDISGNYSPVIPKVFCDSTVFLKANFDSCSSSISINWNDYNRWRGNIADYKIYSSIDGANYQLYNTVTEGTTNYTINNINANQLYRFYIKTTCKNTGDSVFSNRVDINTNMSVNPDYIHADYGTVNGDHPAVRFSVDPSSQLSKFVLLRADSPTSQFDSIRSIPSVGDIIEYADESVSSSKHAFYYKLNALNYCDQIVRSSDNVAGTIFLESIASGLTINLTWNEYYYWINGVSNYRIERKLNSRSYEDIISTQDHSYTDNSFANQGKQMVGSEICYRITAFENPFSSSVSSTSNEACVRLEMNVRFEFDAFIPGSTDNSSFGPTMDFIPESIKFSIFNRWGNLVFESSDPNNLRWNGFFKGEPADQGVYMYQLEYKSETGKKVVLNGKVTVVYP